MKDTATAYIRTYAPILAATIISLGIQIGLNLDSVSTELTTIITALLTAVYYAIARLIGKKFPGVETLLLGSSKTPDYGTKSGV